ncbi:MAG: type III pantothenate kinase [candidate division Zixibacteria bacterium]|nr:type III pantothenate kinase [candidate division Zixibacteria bacterium]
MLMAIDIGNTNTVVGVFDGIRLINHFRVASNHSFTIDECGFIITGLLERLNIDKDKIDQVAVASVVPSLTPIFEKMLNRYFQITPLIISSKLKLPIKIVYHDPTAVGADRIANAVAGFSRVNGAVIIVDFGTSTNFDVVTDNGSFVGGVIAPGPRTSGLELARKAARLFEVRLEKPERVIGRSTAESIKSGLFYGAIGQVDLIVQLILDELGFSAKVIATGGLAEDFAPHSRFIESIYPTLTLDGLRLITDYQTV